MSLSDPWSQRLGCSLVSLLYFFLCISLILSDQLLPCEWKSSCLQLPDSHLSSLIPKRVYLTSLSAIAKVSV